MMELSSQEKEYLVSFVKNFAITNAYSVLEFGRVIEERIGTMSSVVLSNTKNKDNSEIEIIIKDIINELDRINYKPKKVSFFMKLFGYVDEEPPKPNYNSMLKNIELLVKELNKHIIVLQKDIHLLKLLSENSDEYLHELDMYLLAGKQVLEKAKTEANKLKSENRDLEYNDYVNAINNFEKRIHDLELTRMVCVQNLPQIGLIINNNYVVADRINYLINSTIPLWKSQIIIIMSQQKEKELLDNNKEVSEMMNQILLNNATSLKGMTESTREELTKGYVSSKSLTETTKLIVSSLNELEKTDDKKEEKSEVLTLK